MLASISIGDKAFRVDRVSNVFFRKRVTKTDSEGVTWYRQDAPAFTYTITELVCCGTVEYTITGETRFNEDALSEVHFKAPSGETIMEYLEDLQESETWFKTKQEAESYIASLTID